MRVQLCSAPPNLLFSGTQSLARHLQSLSHEHHRPRLGDETLESKAAPASSRVIADGLIRPLLPRAMAHFLGLL